MLGMDERSDPPKTPSCPICGKPAAVAAVRPFCSARCRDVDLHRWFSGTYAVPAAETAAEETPEIGKADERDAS